MLLGFIASEAVYVDAASNFSHRWFSAVAILLSVATHSFNCSIISDKIIFCAAIGAVIFIKLYFPSTLSPSTNYSYQLAIAEEVEKLKFTSLHLASVIVDFFPSFQKVQISHVSLLRCRI